MHVDVFEFGLPDHLTSCNLVTDDGERLDNLAALVGSQQANLGQHPCMSLRAANIDGGQPMIKRDRLGELFNSRVGLFIESTAPRFDGQNDLQRKK
jgi:hypothetical protein